MRLTAVLCALAVTASLSGCSSGKSAPVQAFDNTAAQQLTFGVQMARRQLWNEALFRFRQAAELEPNNPRIVNNLAVACEATGRFDEALEYYRDALRLSPTDRTVKGNYSRFVEFYQSLKPPEESGEDGADDEASKAGAALSE